MDSLQQVSLFTEEADVVGLLTSMLMNIGCCPRCTLRFMGETRCQLFKNTNETLSGIVKGLINLRRKDSSIAMETKAPSSVAMDTKDPPSSTMEKADPTSVPMEMRDPPSAAMETRDPPCVICLGILQQFCTEDFVDKIKAEVEKAGFQFSQHFCSLMLPPCIIIREHSLWLYLEERFPEIYNCRSVEIISTIKDIWKWRMGPVLSQKLGAPFEMKSQFDICTTFTHVKSNQECSFLSDLFPDTFKKRKTNSHYGWEMFTRASVSKALLETANSSFKSCYGCPPSRPIEPCTCESIVPSHKQVYLAGRYNKYSRFLSQTPWVIEGEKKTVNSVEELVCNLILPKFKPDDHKFSASGREDVDVRMLGSGRPFIIQLINPHIVNHSPDHIRQMQKLVNSNTTDIAVRDLQLVPRDETTILKEGEIEKTKSYLAHCWCDRSLTEDDLKKLENMKDIKLYQKTPIRVLHRRSLAVRERIVYSLRPEVIDEHHFNLHLSTQAGTYIKEFIHGDLGRTKPSLGTILGAECDILELDVESVDVDWPKRLDDVESADQPCAVESKDQKDMTSTS